MKILDMIGTLLSAVVFGFFAYCAIVIFLCL